MATYFIVDGHSLAYRAFFALQESGLSTSSGQETHAVYGFVSMVTKLCEDHQPDGMVVALDRPEPTFRDAIAADYKAGRAATPDSLIAQVELIRTFVEALGIPVLEAAGFEADDIIATVATRLAKDGNDVVIVTGDRDAFQLVEDPHIKVLYNRRGVSDYALYDEAGIFERTGVMPKDYPLLAALRGDPSDNLPGVPGVGEKIAARLVNQYGSFDEIVAHLSECTPKLRESLAQSIERVHTNLELIPVVRDVPVDFETESFALDRESRPALEQLFGLLEMRMPRDRLFGVLDRRSPSKSMGPDDLADRFAARTVTTFSDDEALVSFIGEVAAKDPAEFVLEASYAALLGRSPITALVCVDSSNGTLALITPEQLEKTPVRSALGALLGNPNPRLVAQRSKELMRSLGPYGIDVRALKLDTAVVAYLVDPVEGQFTLEELATRRSIVGSIEAETSSPQLGFDLEGSDPQGKDAQGKDAMLAARRAEVVERLAGALEKELDEAGETTLWEAIERPLVRVLARMELAGIAVDAKRLQYIIDELTDEARRLEGEIHGYAGESFNVNSTPQLRTVLYEKLQLKPQRKTKTGYSTDAATLERLRDEHPIVEALLRYREVEKLRSTYGEGLIAEIASDGRIHASFNQTVARTGRLSSDAPNLHNIPVRSDEGRRFRDVFVAKAAHELLVADYNQVELRVIAHLAKDPGLIEAFANGRDIHTTTAAGVFRVPDDAVTPSMRAKAKMISYGLAYGMEAYGLAQRLQIGIEEANEILRQYFEAFPSVRAYMDATVIEAKRRGFTETERGRRRYIPDLKSDNFRVRQAAERQAMNSGIQGLAADIFKIALVALDNAIEEAKLKSRIVLQVHDEVILEVPLAEHEHAEQLTRAAMTMAYPLAVPLEVNLAWGSSWGDAKQH